MTFEQMNRQKSFLVINFMWPTIKKFKRWRFDRSERIKEFWECIEQWSYSIGENMVA